MEERKPAMRPKLVRDQIPDIILWDGKQPHAHTATPAEYRRALKVKLVEEAKEFMRSGTLDELADVLEVLIAILKERRVSRNQLDDLRREKLRERGGFTRRIILDRVSSKSG